MQRIFRTVLFHFLCIIIFGLFYFYFRNDFESHNKEPFSILDCIFLSTTIQSGVGLTDIYPINFNGKLLMTIQQVLLIMTYVFTLYIFTL
jgi:hypothetical protein